MSVRRRSPAHRPRLAARPSHPARGLSRALAAVCGLALLAATACAPEPARPPRTILLIVLDTASAFFMGAYGEAAPTTPRIDRLAADSVVFDHAYSQSATTTASTASLFTGVRVTTHRIFKVEPYSAELHSLAELLRDGGFSTRAVVGNYYAGAPALGFDRGFDDHVRAWESTGPEDSREGFRGEELRITRPNEISEQVIRQLDAPREDDAFFYVHYLRPHEPYDPPLAYREMFPPPAARCRKTVPEWTVPHRKARLADNVAGTTRPCTRQRSEALYRATMRWVDDGVGQLIDALKQRSLYDESLIVLTSDHGEAFFGHRIYGHNATLYDDMTRIPLMIKLPTREDVAPRRLANLVETIDILPTLLDWAGLPPPPQLEGDSLLPLVRGEATALGGDEVISTTLDRRSHAIRVGDFKYIHTLGGEPELYDLSSDRLEQRNLAGKQPRRREALARRLDAVIAMDEGEQSTLPEPPDEARVRALLERLGYVEGAEPGPEP